jgi:hypothetical protein
VWTSSTEVTISKAGKENPLEILRFVIGQAIPIIINMRE